MNVKFLGINPPFENDKKVVPIPSGQAAFANRPKPVERDVEICR